MIRKLLILIIIGNFILGTALPVLAAEGSEGSSSGSSSDTGSSSGSSGSSSDTGSSSGSSGSSSDTGSSSGGSGSSSDTGSSSGSSGSSSDTGSSSGSSGQGQSGTGLTSEPTGSPTREQSQEHIQVTSEPTGVPSQDQSQDQLLTPGDLVTGASPQQSQDLSQSRDQTDLTDQYLQQVQDKQSQLLQDQQLAQDQDRLKTELALYSITIAAPVSGSNATQFISLANQINQSYAVADQAQTRIENRDPVTRFFLGGDTAAAETLLQLTDQNQDRIHLLEQELQNCDCNLTIRDQLQQQLVTLDQDQDRLKTLANQTLQDKGLLGGLFR
jgi:hypothetical protein